MTENRKHGAEQNAKRRVLIECREHLLTTAEYNLVLAAGVSDMFRAVKANDHVRLKRLLQSGVCVDIRDKVIPPVHVCVLAVSIYRNTDIYGDGIWSVWFYWVGMGGCRMERLPLVLPLGMDMSKL